jgi:hypothetical protein
MINTKGFFILVSTLAMILPASSAIAGGVLKSRLDCIESLASFSQKGPSTSFKFLEKVKDVSLLEFSAAIIGMDKRKNLMTLPTTRNGERGLYLFSDEGSFWHPLPKLRKKGEFLPQYLKVENNQISKSPLYLIYYDGVESTGAEYSNKSVSLHLNKSDIEAYAPIVNIQTTAIQDSESEKAFLNNYKLQLSKIQNVYERSNELKNASQKKQFTEKLKAALGSCTDSLKKSGDKEYLELIKAASEEFKTALTSTEKEIKTINDSSRGSIKEKRAAVEDVLTGSKAVPK